MFHCLYHTDQNALIGAPTGSGKTLCAELAIFRLITEQPKKKVCLSMSTACIKRELVNLRLITFNRNYYGVIILVRLYCSLESAC